MRFGSFRAPLAVLILALALLAGQSFTRFSQPNAQAAGEEDYRRMRLFTEVLDEIQKKYVEKKTTDELLTEAIKGMVSSLDPHSSYMTPEEYKDLQVETKGSFFGVGIEITVKDGVLTVVSPIEDTPAYKAGVEAGDRIIKIDGKLTKGMNSLDAVKAIRGPKGTAVVLTVLREGTSKFKDITIVRDLIPLKSVRYFLLEDGYGYIRISNFQENTTEDLIKALKDLQGRKPPLAGLVLDLRNDPGGLLQEAVNVSDQFLNEGMIVSTKNRDGAEDMAFKATPMITANNYPIIILVNQGTASASEIVAGALQDHKRALVMGTPTFGKGSVQTIIPLDDEGALRLTTARYYTPSGRAIQAKGIEPDLLVPFMAPPDEPKEDDEDRPLSVREKDLQGAMAPEDNPAQEEASQEGAAEKEKAKPAKDAKEQVDKIYYPQDRLNRDNQLNRALDLLKAWKVFSPLTLKAHQRQTAQAH